MVETNYGAKIQAAYKAAIYFYGVNMTRQILFRNINAILKFYTDDELKAILTQLTQRKFSVTAKNKKV